MRQLFKTRYTKKDPRIKAWYGGLQTHPEIIVAYPLGMSTPFLRRDLTGMETFAEDYLEEELLFTYYDPQKNQTPKDVLSWLGASGVTYEEVVF